ncbi:MAG: folate-binding protein, partial [Gammaproteobacteria bacterium]
MTPLHALQGTGALLVSGEDAVAFLHAQLCADVRSLTAGDNCLTAWCAPNGRVLHLVRLIRRDGDCLLALPADQVPALREGLLRYRLRSRVELEPATLKWWGAAGEAPRINECARARIAPGLWLLATDGDPPEGQSILAEADLPWRRRELEAGIPALPAVLSGEFLPQMLRLDEHGGLSFNKGCYPGQEVIARLHFRGRLKRRWHRFRCPLPEPPAPATRLLDDGGTTRGVVVDGVPVDRDGSLLGAVVEIAAL